MATKGPIMLSWLELTCPNCHTTNWVDNGDPADMTGFDDEGYECWKCQGQFTLEGEEVEEEFLPGDPLPHFTCDKLVKLIGEDNANKLIKNE